MREEANLVILGAGLAGAASAWALSRSGVEDIVVLEREIAPGTHASAQTRPWSARWSTSRP
jgi:glycine/D-amino acid oxidase-like deaminating enzyme